MKIKNIWTITKSELAGYLVSPAAYVFIIIFLILTGFLTFGEQFGNFYGRDDASLESMFYYIPLLSLILIPAIGMHMWSDERRLGTNELLFTFPVTLIECIISKFLAAWLIIGIALLMTFPMIITVFFLGSPDKGAIISGYLGSFLMAGAYLAIASFTSTFTKSLVVSFIVSFVICFFLTLAGHPGITSILSDWGFSSQIIDTIASFSTWSNFIAMGRGVIDSRNVIYYISVIFFGLYLTKISLKNQKDKIIVSVFGAVIIGLNIILINALLGTLSGRLDITDNKIYTLSSSTHNILSKLKKPVTIKFYFSKSNKQIQSSLKDFGRRIEDLLQEYKIVGKGNIFIKKYDPKLFSDAEDSAILDGIYGNQLKNGEKVYLGLAVSCGKKTVSFPVLSPAKENLLEYEITSAIAQSSRTKKPLIGIMSPLNILGGPPTNEMLQKGIIQMQPSWYFAKLLKKNFELKKIDTEAIKIDDEIKLLLIFHPAGISNETQFAIDQYILKGGRVIVFVDPWSLVAKIFSQSDSSLKNKLSSDLPKLFKSWGIQYTPKLAVSDAVLGKRMEKNGMQINYLSVLDLSNKEINQKDMITSKFSRITLLFPGAINSEPVEGLEKEILMHSTKNSCLQNSMLVDKPSISFREFNADDQIYNLGIKITGKFKTAFPDGNPIDKDKKEPFLKEGIKDSAVIIISDVDFLFDQFCITPQNFRGRKVQIRMNENLALGQNIVDSLGGDRDLMSIRSRPSTLRPFTKKREDLAKAEGIFKEKVLKLKTEAELAHQRWQEFKKFNNDKDLKKSPEKKKYDETILKISKKIRGLQNDFWQTGKLLPIILQIINMLAVPILIAIFGCTFGIIRKIRCGTNKSRKYHLNMKELINPIIVLIILTVTSFFLFKKDSELWERGNDTEKKMLIKNLQVSNIAKLEITNDSKKLEIEKNYNGDWVVVNRNNYPVNFKKLESLITKLNEITVIQEPRSLKEQFSEMKLIKPVIGKKDEKTGTLLELKDEDGKSMLSLIIGEKHYPKKENLNYQQPKPDGCYVMIEGTDKPALINNPLSIIDPDPKKWIDPQFIKIPDILSVTLKDKDGKEIYKLYRTNLKSPWILDGLKKTDKVRPRPMQEITSTFEKINFDDVYTGKEFGMKDAKTAVVTTERGIIYKFHLLQKDKKIFAKVSLDGKLPTTKLSIKDPSNADQEVEAMTKKVQAKAEKLKKLLEKETFYTNWIYEFPIYKIGKILKDKEDLYIGDL